MRCGCSCGSIRGSPAAPPVSPLQIVAADDIIAGWDAAVRVDTAGAVSVLPDVSGNGFNLAQATAANQPTAVVGGGPNGNDSILFDGVDDFLSNGLLDLPAPGTIPTTVWAIIRLIASTVSGDRVLSTSPGAIALFVVDLPDRLAMTNAAGLFNEVAIILNQYGVLETLFSGSPSDVIDYSGVSATGDVGNTDPAVGFRLGTNPTLALFANFELCELWLFRTALSIQQRSQLRAYATARYGAIP